MMCGNAGVYMAGQVKKLIDEFVQLRTGGQEGLEHFVRAHLVLSGVNPSRYNESSPDNAAIEQKLKSMIAEFSAKAG
jgi:hypothetical protein